MKKCKDCGKIISKLAIRCSYCRTGILASHWKGGKEKRKCIKCGNEFYVFPYRKKVFCSYSCAKKGNKYGFTSDKMVGENNPNWKGGISKNVHSTKEPKYKEWRKSVFERDNYTCKGCGLEGCYLEAHHIKGWAKYPKLRYELNNGVTLCVDCHKLTDNYKGKING